MEDSGENLTEKVDLSTVRFLDLKTHQEVNLAAYMRASDLDHVLLTFGSKNCAACNRKAKALTDQVIGRHPLFLTDVGRRFTIIGVNTDPVPERLGGYLQDFPFIRWSDVSGRTMVSHFAPQGSRFRVPLTVMVRRDGILWRILPDDHISVEEMMGRIEDTLGLDASADSPQKEPDSEGGPAPRGGNGPAGLAPLSVPGPSRFDAVQLMGCEGPDVSLKALFRSVDWRFVQVVRGACDDDCAASRETLRNLGSLCREAGIGLCRGLTLEGVPQSARDPGRCQSDGPYRGSEEFLKVFASHFDWNYPKDIDASGQPFLSKSVQGPFVLGFRADGTLIFSREGAVRSEELMQAIKDQDPLRHARGPDFGLFDAVRGHFAFADWRSQAKFTVVMGWSTICTSCDAQLKHWSQPGQLIDFCASRPQDCQVGAVENVYPGTVEALTGYYQGLLSGVSDGTGGVSYDGFEKLGIRVPLLLDPVADGPGPMDYLNRLHDGYMLASSRDVPAEHRNDFRTFIYDQEGKVIARFYGEVLREGEDDLVLQTLRQYLAK